MRELSGGLAGKVAGLRCGDFGLGSSLNLSGLSPDWPSDDEMRYADLRAGMSLEAAKAGTFYTETHRTSWLNSASIYLVQGRSDNGSSSFYLFIGTP